MSSYKDPEDTKVCIFNKFKDRDYKWKKYYGLRVSLKNPYIEVDKNNIIIEGIISDLRMKYSCNWVWLQPEYYHNPDIKSYGKVHYHGFVMLHDHKGFDRFIKQVPPYCTFHIVRLQTEDDRNNYYRYCLKEAAQTEGYNYNYNASKKSACCTSKKYL